MYTAQVSQIKSGTVEQRLDAIYAMLGDCRRELQHNGPMTLEKTWPAGATQATLTVKSYIQGAGNQVGEGQGIAAEFDGLVNFSHGPAVGGFVGPIGSIQGFHGTVAALNAALALSPGWFLADGTNGTVDTGSRAFFGYDAGTAPFDTIGNTGGASTHFHAAGTSGSGGTGATGAASGNTGAASGNTASATPAGMTCSGTVDSHTHGITPSTGEVEAGTGTTVIVPPLGTTGAATPAFSGTVSGGAHVHGLDSHVHTLNSHTHTGPDHTHTTPASDSQSNLPPYRTVAWVQRVS